MALQLLRLTKHFGNLTAGEVGGYTPDAAAHIIKNQGGLLIGAIDPAKQVHVMREVDGEMKDLIVDAEPELVDGKPTGNLVAKPEPKKAEPKKDAKKAGAKKGKK
jgi:hypothetical protein